MKQKINYFSQRAFRDTADKDYIHARMAYRGGLFPQFHWSALHALEKYAKCIALLTRTSTKNIKHEIIKTINAIPSEIGIELSEQTIDFINRLEDFGARFRYFETSWFIHDCEIAFLDRAVWELRRYCNPEIYIYSEETFLSIDDNYCNIKNIEIPSHENTFIPNGFIEQTLSNNNSNSRPYLIWCNLYYSKSNRKSVKVPSSIMAENSPFYLFPEIIDEVSKYVFIPKEIKLAYKKSSI